MLRRSGTPAKRITGPLWASLVLLSGALAAAVGGTPPPPTERTEHCATAECHRSILDREVRHGPVAQQKCDACHLYEEPRTHRFRLAVPEEELCESCHHMSHRTVIHTPVRERRCVACHDPHGSAHRMMLVDDPTRGLCLSCHSRDFTESEFVHGPVAAGACILCHEPHSSWEPRLLVDTPEALCAGCHVEIVSDPNSGLHIHAALDDGCASCHDAHASAHRFQLRSSPSELCLTCHDAVAAEVSAAAVVHGPTSRPDGCVQCHTPHSSVLADLQKLPEPQSCLACHDHGLTTDAGRVLTDMKRLLDENPIHHGPIREGACSECHQPHASARSNLLVREYPPEFYARFDLERYALCFTCHIPELVLQASGAGLTGFRDGDVNLHWIHVNQVKGRTCRACHEVHASKRPFHMRDAVPFGSSGWMLEINYEIAADGGSCAPGCHERKSYRRGDFDAGATQGADS